MERIRDRWNRPLVWRQDRPLVGDFVLRDGDVVLATMERPSPVRMQCVAKAYDLGYLFTREHGLARRMDVRDARSGRRVAALDGPWLARGWLVLRSGRRYRWRRKGFGLPSAIEDESGQELVRLTGKFRAFSVEADLEVHEAARDLLDLPLLVIALWYVRVAATMVGVSPNP